MANREAITALVFDASRATAGASQFEQAAQRVTAANSATVAATDRVSVGMAGYERSLNRLRGQLDPYFAAQTRLTSQHDLLQRAVQRGSVSIGEAASLYDVAKARALSAADGLAGLAKGHDHVTGSASRMREGLVLVHEFLRGDWKRAIGSATIELQNFGATGLLFNPITLGLIALGGAAALAYNAFNAFAASQRELTTALRAGGDSVGFSRSALEDFAQSLAETGDISVSEGRSIEGALARTGKIGGQVFVDLAKSAADFGALTGRSTTQAAAELAKLFSDPAKGAKELDAAYNLLSAAQLKDIENLEAQGQRGAAQKELLDALNQRSKGLATDGLSALEHAWIAVKNAASNAADATGKSLAGPDLQERINRETDAANHPFAQFNPLRLLSTPPVNPFGADDRLNDLLEQQRHEQQLAAQRLQDAAGRDLGKTASSIADSLSPTAGVVEKLTNDQTLLSMAIAVGAERAGLSAEQFERLKGAYAGVSAAIPNILTPLQRAQRELDDQAVINALPPDQRAGERARRSATLSASQNPQTAADAGELGRIAGAAAENQQSTAAGDATRNAIDQAQRQVAAHEALARAAGISSEALRQASVANEVAAFAAKNGATATDAYRAAVERASQADKARELNATVLGLNQQADAAQRVAAVAGQGAAAMRQATVENTAFAEALKFGAQGSTEFAEAYQKVLDAIQRKDAAETTSSFQKELVDRQNALQVAQAELAALDGQNAKHSEQVALLKAELALKQQFPNFDQQQIDQLAAIDAAKAKTLQLEDQKKQAEKDFNLLARQGINDIVKGLEDAITGAKSFKDVWHGLLQAADKAAINAFVTKPLNGLLDSLIGPGKPGGGGASDAGGPADSLSATINNFLGVGPGGLLGDIFGSGKQYAQPIGPGLPGAPDPIGAVAKLLTGSATDLSSAGKGLATVPNLFQSLFGQQLTSAIYVQAATAYVSGESGAASGAGGGLSSIPFIGQFLGGGSGGSAGGGLDPSFIGGSADAGASTFAPSAAFFSYHRGGLVGSDGTPGRAPLSSFIRAPRFHDGFAPDEIPAVLQVGERVLNRRETAAFNAGAAASGGSSRSGGRSRPAPSVTMVINTPDASSFGASSRQIAAQYAKAMDRASRRYS